MNIQKLNGISAFQHGNFRLFWFGQLISLMGTWMQNMAQVWLVLQITNSPFLLGLTTAIQFTPYLLFSLMAGVIVDRIPKRRLLLITQFGQAVLALILGLLTMTGIVRFWHVLILAGLLGLLNTFDMPARQSFVIEMVGKKDLPNAIALNSTAFNLGRIVGPAIAGIIIGKLGIAACFLINSASFVAVIAGLYLMRSLPVINFENSENNIWQNIKEGLKYIRSIPIVFNTIILMAIMSTFTMNLNVLVPLIAKNNLRQGAVGFGLLLSALGIGALLGALILAGTSGKVPGRHILFLGAGCFCIFQILFALCHYYILALILLIFTGWAMIAFTTSVNTTLQLNSSDNFRGRVMSVYTLVFGGVIPIGSLISGTIAHVLGAPTALIIGAAIGLSSLMIVVIREKNKNVTT